MLKAGIAASSGVPSCSAPACFVGATWKLPSTSTPPKHPPSLGCWIFHNRPGKQRQLATAPTQPLCARVYRDAEHLKLEFWRRIRGLVAHGDLRCDAIVSSRSDFPPRCCYELCCSLQPDVPGKIYHMLVSGGGVAVPPPGLLTSKRIPCHQANASSEDYYDKFSDSAGGTDPPAG